METRTVWRTNNSIGDFLTCEVNNENLIISYQNKKEGYAGGTEIPMEMLRRIIKEQENGSQG